MENSFPEIDFFAVTSVKTEHRSKDGKPGWFPKDPLESEGFDPFLQRVHDGLAQTWKTNVRVAGLKVKRGFYRTVTAPAGWFRKTNLLLLFTLGISLLAPDEIRCGTIMEPTAMASFFQNQTLTTHRSSQ